MSTTTGRPEQQQPALEVLARPQQRLHVVAYDFGIKLNILRMLVREGCRVTVVPAGLVVTDGVLAGANRSAGISRRTCRDSSPGSRRAGR